MEDFIEKLEREMDELKAKQIVDNELMMKKCQT